MGQADKGRPELTIHGPPVLSHYLATARSYLRRDKIKVQVKEASLVADSSSSSSSENRINQDKEGDFVVFKDENIAVQALPLFPTGFTVPSELHKHADARPSKRRRGSSGTLQQPNNCLQLMFPNMPQHQLGGMDERAEEVILAEDTASREKQAARIAAAKRSLGKPLLLPTQTGSGTLEQAPVLLYIVRGKSVRGKFDVQKAKAMGVPQGNVYALLTNGGDVEIDRPKDWKIFTDSQRDAWLGKLRRQITEDHITKKGKKTRKGNPEATVQETPVETEKILIKSSDVMGATRAGTTFIQIYLPSFEYLDSFLDHSTQSNLQSLGDELHTIIHSVHPDVLQDQRYQAFLQTYKTVHHIILSRPFLPNRLAFPSSALASMRMSLLDKTMFQVPAYSLEPKMKLLNQDLKDVKIYLAGLDTSISLYPRGLPGPHDEAQLDFDHLIDSEVAQNLASFENIPGRKLITEESKKAKQEAWKAYVNLAKSVSATEAIMNGHNGSNQFPLQLTTLGTGSAMPSKHRNVSATLVHLPGKDAGYILLDAGESTYAQLKRRFDQDVDEVIANIRMVFLSHIHGDHHMGLSRLLVERSKLNVQRPLFVIAPDFVQRYVEEVNEVFSLDIQDRIESNGVIFIGSQHLDSWNGVVLDRKAYPESDSVSQDSTWRDALAQEAKAILTRNTDKDISVEEVNKLSISLYNARLDRREQAKVLRNLLVKQLHGTEVFTALVDHRAQHCYGIIFRGQEWSGAYSGDTRPSVKLIQAGRGVDFLLHEATIEDSKPEMADMKGHSTFGQAIEVAKQMGVKYVMLTHFSQRYPKLPKLSANENLGELKVGIAFDLLTVQLSDFEKLMRYKEPLELLFQMDGEEEELEEEGDEVVVEGGGSETGAKNKAAVIKATRKGPSNGSSVITSSRKTDAMEVDSGEP